MFKRDKRHMRYKLIFPVFLFLFMLVGNLQAEENLYALVFKEVITDQDVPFNPSRYVFGRHLYPQYSYHGLPENFLIKKSPDISIAPTDIESVSIVRNPFSQSHVLHYMSTITFKPRVANQLFEYTKRNLEKRIAIEIDGRILAIPTILQPIENILLLDTAGMPIEVLQSTFQKISANVTVKDDAPDGLK